MPGILSYGAYLPATRLALGALGGRSAREGGPEKAVAWNDEDAITLGVTAAVNCLRGLDRSQVDAVLFASTTQPFREKQAAALVARTLDLRRDVQSTDLGGSLRAGTSALRAAADAVAAGSAKRVLVIASDCRTAAPGSALEAHTGDAAAAFLIGEKDAIATFDSHFAVADEIVDVWRSEGDPFIHSWEDRFVVQEGYTPVLVEALRGLLAKLDASAADFARFALYGPDKRSHGGVARALHLEKAQVVDPLFGRLGNAGCAFAPLLLVSALEQARAGERIAVGSYGDGAEALAFGTTELLAKLEPRRGVAWHLERRRPVTDYDRYLKARSLTPSEWQRGGDPGLSATIHFRERDDDLSFKGQKCRRCAAIQFPAQRVCETCYARDDFEKVRLSDRVGKIVTYTFDFFFPTPDPPTIVTVSEVDGARIHLQVIDCPPKDVKIGMPLEFVFRRIHEVGGRPNYYWKGTPLPEDAK